jgi:3-oxoacyl-[acyl-carrier-protein] synthase II
MRMKRVVITGRGAVSPFGTGVAKLVDNIWAGASAVRAMPEWEHIGGMKSRIAAPVPDFDARDLLPRHLRRSMGKMAQYAAIAAIEAIRDASLSEDLLHSGKTGVAVGSTTGSPTAYFDFYRKFLPDMAIGEIKSGEFFQMMGHSCAANICLATGIRGEQWAPASACTSSSQAIGLGCLLIRAGRQEIMLCGGADEVHVSVTGVFDLLRAASTSNATPERAPRPFSADRDGVVCGGGSGILVLEDYDSARRRGAHIYAEILGFGNVNDSDHIAHPNKDPMARAMLAAMDEAGVTPADIDYVNAHATGTEQGDKAEAAAVFQTVGGSCPVSSFKGHIGHTLGAAGALESIILLEMLRRQEIIPTRNLQEADPECTIVNLIKTIENHRICTVIKNNFALGGVNTALVFRTLDS